jgi:hypothetical protein
MLKKTFVGAVLGLLLFGLSGVVFASGVGIALYGTGKISVGMFHNTVGAPVTGLHIEFDQEVTIVNKVEFGGFLPALGELTGTSFDFAGGELAAGGTLELDWQPTEAMPVLVQWLSGVYPAGAPYFTTLDVLGRLLGQGIVVLREQDPALLAATFEAFFALNEEFFVGLEQSLGMSLRDSLLPVIMSAPAEGIQNFFNTMLGMLGVTTLEELLQGDVDLSPLLALVGM